MSGSTRALEQVSSGAIPMPPRVSTRGFAARLVYVLRRNRPALFGAIIIFVFFFVAIFADQLAPYPPNRISLSQRFIPPNLEHPFGTDNLGRDILSRVIYGARVSLWVGVLTVGLAMIIGIPAGLL